MTKPTTEEKGKNLPWVEKYRPATLNDLISHEDIVKTIKKFVDTKTLPHLLLYGPPGTGKTSTILACARQLYTPQEYRGMVLELNASDDRGINVVREDILTFTENQTLYSKSFKLVILDEADAMTSDAQAALRRIMEKYSSRTRFCLICNYLSKITPAIQSRCTKFRFSPLKPKQIIPRLDFIIQQEGIKNVDDEAKTALITLANGDMRRVINNLQSTYMAFGDVTSENVFRCCGQPTRSDMEEILSTLLDKKLELQETFKTVSALQLEKGLALQDLVTRLHLMIHDSDLILTRKCEGEIGTERKMNLITDLADVESQLSSGGSEKIQLAALVSAFHEVAQKKK